VGGKIEIFAQVYKSLIDGIFTILNCPFMESPSNSTIDFSAIVASNTEIYKNVPLTFLNDHVIRLSIMTEPFYWHHHPNSDETFLTVEG
jgi:hypothetical protein